MTSEPIRDPVTDDLLTPQNAALVVIDYQPSQVGTVTSIDHELLVDNIVSVARLARTFDLPMVLSTINVANGQGPTIPELRAVLSDSPEIDRTAINSWDEARFRSAVEATGRKKLIMTALWTEVCLTYPSLDAMRDGFEVYPVVDAVGGTSPEAHRAGLPRIFQAGAQPISWVSLACELQRDWARTETVADVVDIVLTTRLLKTARKCGLGSTVRTSRSVVAPGVEGRRPGQRIRFSEAQKIFWLFDRALRGQTETRFRDSPRDAGYDHSAWQHRSPPRPSARSGEFSVPHTAKSPDFVGIEGRLPGGDASTR